MIAAGLGIFLYFGIEDVTSFSTIVPMRYSLADSVVSLCVGFVLSFYQLTASPMFYQVSRKLRSSVGILTMGSWWMVNLFDDNE